MVVKSDKWLLNPDPNISMFSFKSYLIDSVSPLETYKMMMSVLKRNSDAHRAIGCSHLCLCSWGNLVLREQFWLEEYGWKMVCVMSRSKHRETSLVPNVLPHTVVEMEAFRRKDGASIRMQLLCDWAKVRLQPACCMKETSVKHFPGIWGLLRPHQSLTQSYRKAIPETDNDISHRWIQSMGKPAVTPVNVHRPVALVDTA